MTARRKSRMGKIPPKYCGDVFLENLINASDKIKRRGWDEEYRKKYDRALIASLFLTGGRATEVLKLRTSSFDFQNKETTEKGAFLVKEFVLMKRGTKGRRLHITHTFPIWYDDPLVDYLLEWVNKMDGLLFPSRIKRDSPLSYHSLRDYVIKAGRRLDRQLFITPEYFRRQRELHLAEKRGFTKSNIKAYLNLKQQIHPIPAIRQEWQNLLVIAQDFKENILPHKKSKKTVNVSLERFNETVKIMNLINSTNFLFKAKEGATLFRENNLKLISELFTPCRNEPQFITKIACLSNLFEVPLHPLKELINEPFTKGSIKIVEKWLNNQNRSDSNMIKTWKSIVILRNAEPIHGVTSKEKAALILDALSFFDSTYPIEDYSMLWDKIIDKFIVSLESWQNILQDLERRNN